MGRPLDNLLRAVTIPPQLLMRDLLRLRVRCSQGLDRGAGVAVEAASEGGLEGEELMPGGSAAAGATGVVTAVERHGTGCGRL